MDHSFWKDRSVLITGCTGFVGTWLSLRLTRVGARVVGLIRDWVPESNFAKSSLRDSLTRVDGSVTDYDTVLRALNEHEVDTCFHLAAQAIVGVANRSPLSTFETNIRGTWTVLEAVRNAHTVSSVIVASSDKAYGTHPESALPYREDHALQGRHPYDVSKSCADLLAQTYWNTYFLREGRPALGITRCGNLYGGGDLNFGRIIPDTLWALVHDRDPEIRSHGLHVRDFLYVLDAVEAYVTLAERLGEPGVSGEAFNFGSGEPVTVAAVVAKCLVVAGKAERKAVVHGTAPAPGEILAQYLDCSKAKARLGWAPRLSLERGLADSLRWYEAWARKPESIDEVNLELLGSFDELGG